MKTLKYISIKVLAVLAVTLAFALPTKAQIAPNAYFNVDWQFNAPLSNDFSDKASGWGMNFEGGGYITPTFGLGLFINYHTNNKYIPRQTIPSGNYASMTTDQQHSIFQLPFGAMIRFRFAQRQVTQPYFGVKLGANYVKTSSYFYVLKATEDSWGFFVSPEIGMNIYPFQNNGIGLHLAVYYSYSTNKSTVLHYDIDKLNNIGFRVGVAF